MAVYSYLFGLLIACVSYIVYQKYANVYPSLVKKPDKRYDYIIGKFLEDYCPLQVFLASAQNTNSVPATLNMAKMQ